MSVFQSVPGVPREKMERVAPKKCFFNPLSPDDYRGGQELGIRRRAVYIELSLSY